MEYGGSSAIGRRSGWCGIACRLAEGNDPGALYKGWDASLLFHGDYEEYEGGGGVQAEVYAMPREFGEISGEEVRVWEP